jgi:hypothetical protein
MPSSTTVLTTPFAAADRWFAAVEVEYARAEFAKRYMVDDDCKDPDDARRNAFKRALNAEVKAKRVGCEVVGRKQLIWLVNEGKK